MDKKREAIMRDMAYDLSKKFARSIEKNIYSRGATTPFEDFTDIMNVLKMVLIAIITSNKVFREAVLHDESARKEFINNVLENLDMNFKAVSERILLEESQCGSVMH